MLAEGFHSSGWCFCRPCTMCQDTGAASLFLHPGATSKYCPCCSLLGIATLQLSRSCTIRSAVPCGSSACCNCGTWRSTTVSRHCSQATQHGRCRGNKRLTAAAET